MKNSKKIILWTGLSLSLFSSLFTTSFSNAQEHGDLVDIGNKPHSISYRVPLEKQESDSFPTAGSKITRLIIDAVKSEIIHPYQDDLLQKRMSKEEFLKYYQLPEYIPLTAEEIAMGFEDLGIPDKEADGEEIEVKVEDIYRYTLEIKTNVFFDTTRNQMIHDIKTISIILPSEMNASTGLEQTIATFSYKEIIQNLFRVELLKAHFFKNNSLFLSVFPNETDIINYLGTPESSSPFITLFLSAKERRINNNLVNRNEPHSMYHRVPLEKQETDSFPTAGSKITKLIIDAVKSEIIHPYQDDLLQKRMSKEDFLDYYPVPDQIILTAEEIAMGFTEEDLGWSDKDANGERIEEKPEDIFRYTLEIKTNVFFDTTSNQTINDIKTISIIHPSKMNASTGLEQTIATFSYKEIIQNLFRVELLKAHFFKNNTLFLSVCPNGTDLINYLGTPYRLEQMKKHE
jgi:hypothetical protein